MRRNIRKPFLQFLIYLSPHHQPPKWTILTPTSSFGKCRPPPLPCCFEQRNPYKQKKNKTCTPKLGMHLRRRFQRFRRQRQLRERAENFVEIRQIEQHQRVEQIGLLQPKSVDAPVQKQLDVFQAQKLQFKLLENDRTTTLTISYLG